MYIWNLFFLGFVFILRSSLQKLRIWKIISYLLLLLWIVKISELISDSSYKKRVSCFSVYSFQLLFWLLSPLLLWFPSFFSMMQFYWIWIISLFGQKADCHKTVTFIITPLITIAHNIKLNKLSWIVKTTTKCKWFNFSSYLKFRHPTTFWLKAMNLTLLANYFFLSWLDFVS